MTSTPMLLVTANVGSIFEDPSVMLKLWTEEFLSAVTKLDPKFVGVHCQEVGGKNYEQSMKHVEFFVELLMASEELRLFDKVRIFLDEDFSSAENFTALGNFYFIHKSITDILIWDFKDLNFVSVEGHSIHSGNIEDVTTKEKSKFPQDFFPECKWSRKGFLRTRWNMNGTVFDLVNIHLFHDASNFIAMETFPSVYSKTRQRALEYTLDRFSTDQNGCVPFFLFGDFNFRTDTQGVIKKLGDGLDLHRIQNAKNVDAMTLEYRDETDEVVMILGKKEFSHLKHENIFLESPGAWLKEFDREVDWFSGRLFEFPIVFPPSYPFEENSSLNSAAHSYMKTRCPAWCDRVMLSLTAKALVHNISEDTAEYNLIGLDTCMGDHKPVYLKFDIKNNEGIVRILKNITNSPQDTSSSQPTSSPSLSTSNKLKKLLSLSSSSSSPSPNKKLCRSCSIDSDDSPHNETSSPTSKKTPMKNIPVKQISFDDSMNLKGSKTSLSSIGLQFSIDPNNMSTTDNGTSSPNSNNNSRKSSIKSIIIDKIKIVKRVNSEGECNCNSKDLSGGSSSNNNENDISKLRTRSVSIASSQPCSNIVTSTTNSNNPNHIFVRSISKLKLKSVENIDNVINNGSGISKENNNGGKNLNFKKNSKSSLTRFDSHHSSSDEDWFEEIEEKIITTHANSTLVQNEIHAHVVQSNENNDKIAILESCTEIRNDSNDDDNFGSTSCFRLHKSSTTTQPYNSSSNSNSNKNNNNTSSSNNKLNNIIKGLKKQNRTSTIIEEDKIISNEEDKMNSEENKELLKKENSSRDIETDKDDCKDKKRKKKRKGDSDNRISDRKYYENCCVVL